MPKKMEEGISQAKELFESDMKLVEIASQIDAKLQRKKGGQIDILYVY